MTLRLIYKTPSQVPVEVEGVTPDVVRTKSLADIEKLEVFQGNVRTELGEFFQVSGDPTDGRMQWEGELAGVHWIGTGMREGCIHIEGDVGRHLGSEMRGGEIHVAGNAGDWVGGEMHRGLIHVHGNAGHLVGSAYRGSPRGMTGGTILVDGSVGNEVGHSMRRGLVAVGDAGDLAGFNMLAGTILVFGKCGIRHGAGMRRGTLVFLGSDPPPILLSFRHACRYRPAVLSMLLRYVASHQYPIPEDAWQVQLNLYNGDLLEGGRGELLVKA